MLFCEVQRERNYGFRIVSSFIGWFVHWMEKRHRPTSTLAALVVLPYRFLTATLEITMLCTVGTSTK